MNIVLLPTFFGYVSLYIFIPNVPVLKLRYSSKVVSHSLDIFECESSAYRVDLLICINGLYSVETAAQRKDSPCNAIAWFNTARLNGFFISKLYFLISLDAQKSTQDRTNSCNSRKIKDRFDHERFSRLARDANSNKQ